MKNPSFTVSTLTISALAILAIAKVALLPILPPSETDQPLTKNNGPSLPAPLMNMEWRSSVEEALQEAKRRDKGVMLFMAQPTNFEAQILELQHFRDPEIVRLVKRNFIPVRVNLDERPEFESLILPLARTQSFTVPGVSVTTMTTEGKLLNHLRVTSSAPYIGPKEIREFFYQAKTTYEQGTGLFAKESNLAVQQRLDESRLRLNPAFSSFRFRDFTDRMKYRPDNFGGGFQSGDFFEIRPAVLQNLCQNQETEEAKRLVEQAVRLGLIDPIDGGVFRRIGSNGFVDTSKNVMHIAACAEAFAAAAVMLNDDRFRQIANSCLRFLLLDSDPPRGQENDQTVDRRSERFSLTQAKLSEILNSDQVEWVNAHLKGHQASRQNLAAIDPEDESSAEWIEIRSRLASLLPPIAPSPSVRSPEISGYVAARLFRCATLLNEPKIAAFAKLMTSRVYAPSDSEAFREGLSLANLLSIADCGLQQYVYERDRKVLEVSVRSLRFALSQYRLPEMPFLVVGNQESPFDFMVPELCDPDRESLTAMELRLSRDLSVLAPDPSDRQLFRKYFADSSAHLAPLLNNSGAQCASIINAVWPANSAIQINTGPSTANGNPFQIQMGPISKAPSEKKSPIRS